MEKVIKKMTLKDSTSALKYWLTRYPQERLDPLEFLRQQYSNFNKNAQPGLQRVCTIINQKAS